MRPNLKPPSCSGCPAAEWGVGFVPPSLPLKPSRIAIVGQGPGELEARYSQPFLPTAPAGRMLTDWLHQAGCQRTEVLITNSVWCWLPKAKPKGCPTGNRDPLVKEQKFCYQRHLGPLLVEHGFDREDHWIFTVGAPASREFLGVEKTEKYLGTVTQVELPFLETTHG